MSKKWVLGVLVLLIFSQGSADGATIGNWSGSGRSWNYSDFSIINSTMTGAGHTVEADEAITASNLSNNDIFLIGEAASTPSSGELSVLQSWIQGGGILLILSDSGGLGVPGNNGILSGIGSALSFGDSASVVTPFPGGIFATTGPPYNLVGQTLSITQGSTAQGGTTLAGDYIHYEAMGLGYIFAFGDRSDHNYFAPSASNVNGQFFLNIAAHSRPGPSVPEPVSIVLLAMGMGLIGAAQLRRRLRK